jgi:hypothetical protein
MSRSFKHNGWIQDQSCKKFGKRSANQKVRRTKDNLIGKSYRKLYQSWDIADYVLQSRGRLVISEKRPGRKFRIIKVIEQDLNDYFNIDNIYRDWMK